MVQSLNTKDQEVVVLNFFSKIAVSFQFSDSEIFFEEILDSVEQANATRRVADSAVKEIAKHTEEEKQDSEFLFENCEDVDVDLSHVFQEFIKAPVKTSFSPPSLSDFHTYAKSVDLDLDFGDFGKVPVRNVSSTVAVLKQ